MLVGVPEMAPLVVENDRPAGNDGEIDQGCDRTTAHAWGGRGHGCALGQGEWGSAVHQGVGRDIVDLNGHGRRTATTKVGGCHRVGR